MRHGISLTVRVPVASVSGMMEKFFGLGFVQYFNVYVTLDEGGQTKTIKIWAPLKEYGAQLSRSVRQGELKTVFGDYIPSPPLHVEDL